MTGQVRPTFLPVESRTPLTVPFVASRAACGFPSPADDYLGQPLDFNKVHVKGQDRQRHPDDQQRDEDRRHDRERSAHPALGKIIGTRQGLGFTSTTPAGIISRLECACSSICSESYLRWVKAFVRGLSVPSQPFEG